MKLLLSLLAVLIASTFAAADTVLIVNIIGLTPDGKIVAWHEKGYDVGGEFERLVVVRARDNDIIKEYIIMDEKNGISTEKRGKAIGDAKREIKDMGIKSGRGTETIYDIYGAYRQITLSARLYLKVAPSARCYDLEVYDEINGRSRVVGGGEITDSDDQARSSFNLRAARLSRDRSTCIAVVREQYSLDGNHKLDKVFVFRVFSGN